MRILCKSMATVLFVHVYFQLKWASSLKQTLHLLNYCELSRICNLRNFSAAQCPPLLQWPAHLEIVWTHFQYFRELLNDISENLSSESCWLILKNCANMLFVVINNNCKCSSRLLNYSIKKHKSCHQSINNCY